MLTATELFRRYRTGELSPVQAVRQSLDAAEDSQPRLNAFITVLRDSALTEAKASEERWRRKAPLGPLDGVPVAVKDLIAVAGAPNTAASKILAGNVSTEDAPVVSRLRQAGAVIIGKTNLHEFAYGGTGDQSFFGPARNPRDPERITGGSSSGSGAAVGGGICPIALGTDTGGSVRIPAALCGITGLKPTYGRVSTAGVLPLSWSFDTVGPMTATVEDAALALGAMCDFPMPDLEPLEPKVGVVREQFFERLEPEVQRIAEGAIGPAREVRIPHIALSGPAQTLISGAEAASYHRRWLQERPEDYSWAVRNRLRAGQEVKAADYVQAARLRGLLVEEMGQALREVDVLAMPTVAFGAPKLFQKETEVEGGPLNVIAGTIRNTAPINFTGFPAISIPCGQTAAGLPVGLQLVAPPWQEARLLRIARWYELRLTPASAG